MKMIKNFCQGRMRTNIISPHNLSALQAKDKLLFENSIFISLFHEVFENAIKDILMVFMQALKTRTFQVMFVYYKGQSEQW